MKHPDRDLRQREIIPPDRLAATSATVIGVGAVGRQVALQLAAIGVPRLHLIDHDIVEPVNLGPQGYLAEDIGRPKVDATAELCHRLNPEFELTTTPRRFLRSQQLNSAVFCCVDSIRTRGLIWQAVARALAATPHLATLDARRGRVMFFADARMSGEVIRILAAADAISVAHYSNTLFRQEEAFVGTCTARSTVFTANIAAGLMIHQFARHLRGLPTNADLVLNLLASEITAHPTSTMKRSSDAPQQNSV